ncbi:MAG: zinc ribbon domain-containing protein [Gemmatimonadota bacterium]|jgi:predicted nucleic acid-binding Zn ribbon protein|nr:MAG: zinc ribbon domain-containing protein [Gemmatimonadota bacterium]
MPYYDYYCDDNDRTVEVRHGMAEMIRTWGELCSRTGAEPGETPADAPVRRVISAGVPLVSRESQAPSPPSCGPSCACAG